MCVLGGWWGGGARGWAPGGSANSRGPPTASSCLGAWWWWWWAGRGAQQGGCHWGGGGGEAAIGGVGAGGLPPSAGSFKAVGQCSLVWIHSICVKAGNYTCVSIECMQAFCSYTHITAECLRIVSYTHQSRHGGGGGWKRSHTTQKWQHCCIGSEKLGTRGHASRALRQGSRGVLHAVGQLAAAPSTAYGPGEKRRGREQWERVCGARGRLQCACMAPQGAVPQKSKEFKAAAEWGAAGCLAATMSMQERASQ